MDEIRLDIRRVVEIATPRQVDIVHTQDDNRPWRRRGIDTDLLESWCVGARISIIAGTCVTFDCAGPVAAEIAQTLGSFGCQTIAGRAIFTCCL